MSMAECSKKTHVPNDGNGKEKHFFIYIYIYIYVCHTKLLTGDSSLFLSHDIRVSSFSFCDALCF